MVSDSGTVCSTIKVQEKKRAQVVRAILNLFSHKASKTQRVTKSNKNLCVLVSL